MIIYIKLDGVPVAKGRLRHAIAGGRAIGYTPKKTRDYEKLLSQAANKEMAGKPLLAGPLMMHVYVFMPIPKSWSQKKRQAAINGEVWPTVKPDWDNYGKITDALNGVVFLDDKQIVKGTVSKIYAEDPALHVMIQEIL